MKILLKCSVKKPLRYIKL